MCRVIAVGFEERLGLLVDAEWNRRQANKLNNLIKRAAFSVLAANTSTKDIISYELSFSKQDGTFRKVINAYCKTELLIIDEWLIRTLSTRDGVI